MSTNNFPKSYPSMAFWINLHSKALYADTYHQLTFSLHISKFCLFDLVLYVPSTISQLNRDRSSWVQPVLSQDKCILLKDHNAVTLESAASRSRVEHSTTKLPTFRNKFKMALHHHNCVELLVVHQSFWVHVLCTPDFSLTRSLWKKIPLRLTFVYKNIFWVLKVTILLWTQKIRLYGYSYLYNKSLFIVAFIFVSFKTCRPRGLYWQNLVNV